MSTLKALGITSQINLEKSRKVVAKRTFEAHDLMTMIAQTARCFSGEAKKSPIACPMRP
jgi:hypothetical protein